jgi:hypothetical protein
MDPMFVSKTQAPDTVRSADGVDKKPAVSGSYGVAPEALEANTSASRARTKGRRLRATSPYNTRSQ